MENYDKINFSLLVLINGLILLELHSLLLFFVKHILS